VQFCGGKSVFVPLAVTEEFFALNTKKIEQSITSKTKLIVLNSPHNPTGWVADKSTLNKLAEIVARHSLLLVSDEVYKDFVYEDEFTPTQRKPLTKSGDTFVWGFTSPEEFSERVIVIDGISKSLSATGLRLGWIIADSDIIKNMLALHQLILFCAPTPFQYAAYEALKRSDKKILAHKISAYRGRRDLVCSLLNKVNGLTITKPNGAFYVFVQVQECADSVAFAERLLEEQHVVVVPGADYGEGWNNFIRVAYAQNNVTLAKACRRLKAFADARS
jgi:aminotransferase